MNILHQGQPGSHVFFYWRSLAAKLVIPVGGIILYWISGGFPPSAGIKFFQMLWRFQALWAQHGSMLLLMLLGLWGQILFISFSWGLLFWHAWHEGKNIVAFSGWFRTLPRRADRPQLFVEQNLHMRESLLPLPFVSNVEKENTTMILPVIDQQPMFLHVAAETHQGLTRAHKPNEDSYLKVTVLRQLTPGSTQMAGLFLVADGMGGHENGQYASSTTVQTIYSALAEDMGNPRVDSQLLREKLIAAVKKANERLIEENKKSGSVRGTTLTGAVVLEQPMQSTNQLTTYIAHIVNIGDSRTYHYSPAEGLKRITKDHSTVEYLIDKGVIPPEARYTDPRRNEIYRCIGDTMNLEVDVFSLSLHAHERLLFCSDGLWEMVQDDSIAQHLSRGEDPFLITSQLIQAALDGGGKDNVTALVTLFH